MKTYKIEKKGKRLEQILVDPEVIYNNNEVTIENCINNLDYNFTVLHTVEGIKIGEIASTDINLPEIEPDITIESVVYFENLEHLRSSGSINLKSGNIARTKGFYTPNDGGGATYLIRSSLNTRVNGYAQENIKKNEYGSRYIYSSALIDNVTLLKLADNLYAEMVIELGTFVNLRQLGGRPLEDGVKIDNAPIIEAALTFMQRKKYFRSIYIPAGHWCFSACIIYHNIRTSAGLVGIKIYGDGMATVCMPFNNSLYYIFKIGFYDSENIVSSESRGAEVSDLTFLCGQYDLSSSLKTLYGLDKYVTTAALYILNATYSTFKNLNFKYVFNTCIKAASDYESHFELLRFHCCGGVRNGKVYPVIQLDISTYSYASSVSANWFTFLHFDSCIGPYIYGGALNNGHNEFNCIIVTGNSETYNTACPDLVSTKTQDTTVKWGIIDNYQGMTNFWPNMYMTVMCCTFNNSVIRDGVQYTMNSILHHEEAHHCHVYLGNVVMPLSSNGSGPWVTYTNADSLEYSVKLLFDEKDWPFYCASKYLPRNTVNMRDPRLIYSALNGNNLMAKYTRSTTTEGPIHLITVGNSTTDLTVFLAKAGKRYALKIYKEPVSDGVWLNAQFNTKYKTGLWIYKNGWIPVGDVKASTLVKSDGNWRYVLIDGFFCFKEDTLVRVSGGGYEFFYEYKYYPTNLLDLTLETNNITNASGKSATYTITKDASISTVTATVSNTRYFSISIANNKLTLTTKKTNAEDISIYTYIRLTGKDSNGNVVTRTSFLSVPLPIAGATTDSYLKDFVATDGIITGSISANLQQGSVYKITALGDTSSLKVMTSTSNDVGVLLTGHTSYFIPSITTDKLQVSSVTLNSLLIKIDKVTSSRVKMPVLSDTTNNYTILKDSSTWYLIDTTGTIYSSTNTVNWQNYGSLSNDLLARLRKSANLNSENAITILSDVEVPYEIKSINLKKVGNYYNLYTTSLDSAGNSWIGLSRSTSITGPFEFVKVIIENSSYPSIRVIDNNVYMIHGEGTLRIDKLDSSGANIASQGRVILNGPTGTKCGVMSILNEVYYIFTSTATACYVYRVTSIANLMNGTEVLEACPNNPVLIGSGSNIGILNPTFPNNVISNRLSYMTSRGLCLYPIELGEVNNTGYWPVFSNTAGVNKQIMQSIII